MGLKRRELLARFARAVPAVLATSVEQAAFPLLFSAERISNQILNGPALSRFGGLPISAAQPTGFFRVEKLANRWVLVDPEGHPFWMLSVDAVDWNLGGKVGVEAAKAKYGENKLGPKFGEHAANRLRSWGFNALGPYAATYALPVPMYGSREGCAVKMPFIRIIRPSYYSTVHSGNVLSEPVKVLISGALDPRVYKGWPGHFPDLFDPKYAEAAKRYAGELYGGNERAHFTGNGAMGGTPHPSLVKEPWLLGTMTDESDTIFGFGPGPEMPTVDGKLHPHLGWIAAVTKPTQTENDAVAANYGTPLKIEYRDPVVYTKVAWRDYLRQKYGEVSVLNRAWGSQYTTFDSDGGWPEGKGLMDESGRNPWIGADAERLSAAWPAVREDLDAFLGILAERYYQVTAGAVRAATPNQLVITSTNNHGGLIRRPILRAAGKYCDLIELTLAPELPEVASTTYTETRRPLLGFVFYTANKDSYFSSRPRLTVFDFPTQENRSAAYRRELDFLYAFQASDGVHPVVGIELWDYMDKWAEQANSGLVTTLGNAYDGKEDVVSRGTDPWGYFTGGEERNYGDFISGVREANARVVERLRQDLSLR